MVSSAERAVLVSAGGARRRRGDRIHRQRSGTAGEAAGFRPFSSCPSVAPSKRFNGAELPLVAAGRARCSPVWGPLPGQAVPGGAQRRARVRHLLVGVPGGFCRGPRGPQGQRSLQTAEVPAPTARSRQLLSVCAQLFRRRAVKQSCPCPHPRLAEPAVPRAAAVVPCRPLLPVTAIG